VKAAIVAADADKKTVALIVDTAILEAPDQLRIIAQCAIAIAPDAIAKIQAVVEKYDKAEARVTPKRVVSARKVSPLLWTRPIRWIPQVILVILSVLPVESPRLCLRDCHLCSHRCLFRHVSRLFNFQAKGSSNANPLASF
jgi:hypothetical protein